MEDLAENNLIRFKSISRKKEGLYANYSVKGIRAGTQFTASISVDIAAAELDASAPLEQIIETCAKLGLKEFRRSEVHFEQLATV